MGPTFFKSFLYSNSITTVFGVTTKCLLTAVVDAVLVSGERQSAHLDVIQLVAYCMCALGFTLNALPSNWSERARGALGMRSRDSAWSEGGGGGGGGIVSSLYQRARRATGAHLP